MKKMALLIVLFIIAGRLSYADEIIGLPEGITVKQGMLVKWKDPESGVANLSTVTIARTKSVEQWGKWNALWDGWTLDAGFAYDATSFDTGALLIGREFGTLGKYLPIEFPLADKIDITLYPVGVYVDNLFEHPTVQGASGVGIIKMSVSF